MLRSLSCRVVAAKWVAMLEKFRFPRHKTFDRIVFCRRQSPPWQLLSRQFGATGHVAPELYEPAEDIPGFPPNIEELVSTWNELFGVNFFECRYILKAIAGAALAKVHRAVIVDWEELNSWRRHEHDLVFFVDDDDWFCPHTLDLVGGEATSGAHAITFPLVRLGLDTYTFVPKDEAAKVIVGRRQDFYSTFQTNNYALNARLWSGADLLRMKDHLLGTQYFDEHALSKVHIDNIVSVTNKTPASVSILPGVIDAEAFANYIRQYVENLRQIELPPTFDWAQSSLKATVALFEAVLRSRRTDFASPSA
jgi:hypothetical protein